MSEQPPPSPVPNGPLTPDSAPAPGYGPIYGPAAHQYGAPPAPAYGPASGGRPQPIPSAPPAGAWRPPSEGTELGSTQPWTPQPGASQTWTTQSGPWPPGPAVAVPGAGPLRSDYAHWGRRVVASLIDFIPTTVALIPLTVAYVMFLTALLRAPLGADDRLPDLSRLVVWLVVGGVLYLLGIVWDIYNRWLTAGRTGRSLGKRVMKLRLIGEATGQPIGPLNAFARDLVHILDGMAYVGYLWPLWDDKRQTFADMLMHTIVIDERGRLTAGVTGPGSSS